MMKKILCAYFTVFYVLGSLSYPQASDVSIRADVIFRTTRKIINTHSRKKDRFCTLKRMNTWLSCKNLALPPRDQDIVILRGSKQAGFLFYDCIDNREKYIKSWKISSDTTSDPYLQGREMILCLFTMDTELISYLDSFFTNDLKL